jgi:molybdate transport system substrate-binding protein
MQQSDVNDPAVPPSRAGDDRPRPREGPRAQGNEHDGPNAAQSDTALHVLSAGAAQGIVGAVQGAFAGATGSAVRASFGAVGAIKAKVRAGTSVALGRVRTGVAVRERDARPEVATADGLRRTLRAASGIYVPDTQQSTAGRHVANVLSSLGISDEVADRLRIFPNGAAAMRELAAATDERVVGITQVTEINNTPGVALVGVLPAELELATVYSAAISTGARHAAAANEFIALLAGTASSEMRRKAGFEA